MKTKSAPANTRLRLLRVLFIILMSFAVCYLPRSVAAQVAIGTVTSIPILTDPTKLVLEQSGTSVLVIEKIGELSRLDLQTGAVTTIASGLSSPTHLAINPNGTTALVTHGDRLSKVDLASGTVTPIVTGLLLPTGVAVEVGEQQRYSWTKETAVQYRELTS